MHGPYILSPDCESQCITTWANPYFCILKSFMNLLKSCITTRPIITITMRWYLGRVGGLVVIVLSFYLGSPTIQFRIPLKSAVLFSVIVKKELNRGRRWRLPTYNKKSGKILFDNARWRCKASAHSSHSATYTWLSQLTTASRISNFEEMNINIWRK